MKLLKKMLLFRRVRSLRHRKPDRNLWEYSKEELAQEILNRAEGGIIVLHVINSEESSDNWAWWKNPTIVRGLIDGYMKEIRDTKLG